MYGGAPKLLIQPWLNVYDIMRDVLSNYAGIYYPAIGRAQQLLDRGRVQVGGGSGPAPPFGHFSPYGERYNFPQPLLTPTLSSKFSSASLPFSHPLMASTIAASKKFFGITDARVGEF